MSTETSELGSLPGFDDFVRQVGRQLTQLLVASFGIEVGQEAADEALAEIWKRWDRVQRMDSPFGYLVTVGMNRGKRLARRRRPVFPAPHAGHEVRIEPGLTAAIEALPTRQRQVVMLVHAFDWSMSEVADALGISKATVQTHCERALTSIRRELGVEQ